jgi:two-component system phosphate regulon sensor histidine kinase PhoR
MEKRTSWRFFLSSIAAILILVIAGDIYLHHLLEYDQAALAQARSWLFLAGSSLAVFYGILTLVFHLRIVQPLNLLAKNLHRRLEGSSQAIEPLHYSNDIGPLLYTVEILLESLALQIQTADSERETLQSVLNQITDGIVIINEQGTINSLNPAAERIFQLPSGQAKGHTVAEILRHHQWIDLYRTATSSKVEAHATLEIPAQKTFLQGIAIPLGETHPGYTLMVFQNLSRIRRLETTRQDFISNLSHELRTPLASLKALTDTLLESALEDPAASKHFLARMDTEVDALTQLVSELLELSKIESGQVPLELKPVPSGELLNRTFERLRAQAERKGLQVQIICGQDLSPVLADEHRLEQVLVNLLHNAIKFSEPGSKVILEAREGEESVVLSVQDFGPGIPENDLERIFERFYKTDQARSSGGTGLGLSIAKHLIEAHQGKIWAESRLNQGSKFYCSLPKVVP